MPLQRADRSGPFYEEMIRILDRLPSPEEYCRVRHLLLQHLAPDKGFTDDDLAEVLAECPHLETLELTGVPETSDRSIVVLASVATNLQGINLGGCTQVSDIGVLELSSKSLPLQWIRVNGVVGLTDPSISAIAKSCSRLIELELCDLPLLSPASIRDIWSYSRSVLVVCFRRSPVLILLLIGIENCEPSALLGVTFFQTKHSLQSYEHHPRSCWKEKSPCNLALG